MDFIAVDDLIGDWTLGIGAVHRNAKRVGTVSRTITPLKSLLNVMDVVL